MNTETAHILADLNTAFYRNQAHSFSETRQQPWPGWDRVLAISKDEFLSQPSVNVFDLGCGNLRFEALARQTFPRQPLNIYAVDNCEELSDEADRTGVCFENRDIITGLLDALEGKSPSSPPLDFPLCDLSVAFGFFHHIPRKDARIMALHGLLSQTRPDGLVAVSFWQFMDDKKMAAKALATTKSARAKLQLPWLDPGDYILGWQDKPRAWRYCHHFTNDEIDELVDLVSSRGTVVDRFNADGRSNSMNQYVIFKRESLR